MGKPAGPALIQLREGGRLARVFLGLGSNLGDREQNISSALMLLAGKVRMVRVSSLYETEPVGYREQPLFLNAVALGETELPPEPLLNLIKSIERTLGRAPSFRNAPRPIDIDILFYDQQQWQTTELTIPHPRLGERAFVLVPLCEIAPELVHPVSGKSVAQMAAEVGSDGVRLWRH